MGIFWAWDEEGWMLECKIRSDHRGCVWPGQHLAASRWLCGRGQCKGRHLPADSQLLIRRLPAKPAMLQVWIAKLEMSSPGPSRRHWWGKSGSDGLSGEGSAFALEGRSLDEEFSGPLVTFNLPKGSSAGFESALDADGGRSSFALHFLDMQLALGLVVDWTLLCYCFAARHQ